MPISFADQLAVAILVALGLAVVGATVWKLSRHPAGPFLGLLMALNRLYVKLWCRHTSNRPTVPEQGGAIVIANHTSPLDPALLQAGTDRAIGFLMAREYYEVPSMNWLYRRVGCIPVNRTGRDTAAAKAALRALERGEVLGIFPEGMINLSAGGLLAPQLGAALIALKSSVPVVPAFISGAPLGFTMLKPFFEPCRTQVRYGPPIDLSAYRDRQRDRKVLIEVGQIMMSALSDLAGAENGRESRRADHGDTTAPVELSDRRRHRALLPTG